MSVNRSTISRRRFLAGTASVSALSLTTHGSAFAQTDEPYYKGKTVELILPFGPGGGTDTTARFIAPYLARHVSGEPPVQVVNRPGAGSILGTNEFARAKRDGLSLFMSGSTIFSLTFLNNPDIAFKLSDFVPVMGFPVGSVVYASPSTGVTKGSELPNSKEPLILPVGGVGVSMARMIGLDLLGVKFKPITGYSGGNARRVAFEQGEVNILGDGTPAYRKRVVPLVKEGKAVPLFSMGVAGPDGGIIRDPGVPDLPHIGEIYQEIFGKAPAGPVWEAYKLLVNAFMSAGKVLWMHSGDPQEAIDSMKAGIQKVLGDPDYQKDVDKLLGGYVADTGKALEDQIKQIQQADASVLEWIQKYVNDNNI